MMKLRVIVVLCWTLVELSEAQQQWQSLLLALQKHKRSQPQIYGQIPSNDQCSSLRAQNARLKQVMSALLEGKDKILYEDFDTKYNSLGRRQRELNPAQVWLNQLAKNNNKLTSSSSYLVTATPTWSTVVQSSTYVTTIVEDVSTEVPIILRGSKIITTIVEPTTLTVTATEVKTSSTLITPTPTWTTVEVVVQPTSSALPWQFNKAPLPLPRVGHQADVLEVGRDTSPLSAKASLDRLRQAFSILVAKQQQVQDNPIFKEDRNPIFGDDYDDYQGLAAQNNPVFVSNTISTGTSVVTLYISGRVPGEYTTSLSTIVVEEPKPKGHFRGKREALNIHPSRVQRIQASAWKEQEPPMVFRELDPSFHQENSNKQYGKCIQHTVTVTVTEKS